MTVSSFFSFRGSAEQASEDAPLRRFNTRFAAEPPAAPRLLRLPGRRLPPLHSQSPFLTIMRDSRYISRRSFGYERSVGSSDFLNAQRAYREINGSRISSSSPRSRINVFSNFLFPFTAGAPAVVGVVRVLRGIAPLVLEMLRLPLRRGPVRTHDRRALRAAGLVLPDDGRELVDEIVRVLPRPLGQKEGAEPLEGRGHAVPVRPVAAHTSSSPIRSERTPVTRPSIHAPAA